MSFVIAAPEVVQSAAQDLAGIGSSLAEASATVSGPTTGILAAAQDEVSAAIASMFGNFGQQFQTVSSQAQAFHGQFVNLVNASAGAYVSAEVANVQQTLLGELSAPGALGGGILGAVGQSFGALTGATTGAPAAAALDLNGFGSMVAAPYQALTSTTATNAQTVFAATGQSLNTLARGTSTFFSLLATDPAAALGNLQTAVQSGAVIGSPTDLGWHMVQHTLGGVTQFNPSDTSQPSIPVNNAHNQIYENLVGIGSDFNPGPDTAALKAVVDLASSPLSGVLMGFAGPFVSPGVALFNEAGAIFGDLTGGNPMGALGRLIGTPATVVNAFFNGASLDISPLAPFLNDFVSAGSDGVQTLTGGSLGFGGLFSPGQVVYGPGGETYYGVGGSFLNSLGVNFVYSSDEFVGPTQLTGTFNIAPAPVGPIGAVAGLIDIFGNALGGSLLPPPVEE